MKFLSAAIIIIVVIAVGGVCRLHHVLQYPMRDEQLLVSPDGKLEAHVDDITDK